MVVCCFRRCSIPGFVFVPLGHSLQVSQQVIGKACVFLQPQVGSDDSIDCQASGLATQNGFQGLIDLLLDCENRKPSACEDVPCYNAYDAVPQVLLQ